MVELLKKHKELLSQLIGKADKLSTGILEMEKKEPGPLISILEKLDKILKLITYVRSRLP